MSQANIGNAFPRTSHRLITLAVASACASMIVPAFAQENPQSPTTDLSQPQAAAPAQTVVVTGIRASMQSTLNLKRNSEGIVDGIVADDIGKFPDTNLAEAVQRISGVSIDRSNGEGQRVTIRGIDPNLNLILLNGRQMPSANLDNRGGRAFDFANLASEAVSQIQVYKTTRADTPTGGIGATLNIMTGRPLDLGNQTSVGGKLVYDRSNVNLPHMLKGKNITPEVSTLISRKFGANDMFGVSLSASYQARNSGSARAEIPNGYLGPFNGLSDPNPNATVNNTSQGVNNLNATQLYETPQNLSYTLRGTQRKRTNAQLTFQFRPTRDWTNTLDYTYAQNKAQVMANALNVWFSGKDKISGVDFVNGPVQTTTRYSENYGRNPQDFASVGNWSGTKTTLKSTGFNTQYRVNQDLRLSLDLHHSVAQSGSDSPYGVASNLSAATYGRNSNTLYLDNEMPILEMNLTPGPFQVNGSWFQDAAIKQTVDQVQAGGSLKIGESSNLNFGIGSVKTKFNSAYRQVQQNAWSGTVIDRARAGEFYDQSNFVPVDYRRYFSKLGGSDDPRMFPTMWIMNMPAVRQDAIDFVTGNSDQINRADEKTWSEAMLTPSLENPDEVRALKEKSNSLHVQFNTDWDTAMPMHTGIGLRYEKTKVDTTYAIKNPVSTSWSTQNEIVVTRAANAATEAQSSDYHYWLPTFDWDMDVTSNLKVRASYGVSIGRPNWDLIQGGTTFGGTTSTLAGFNGSAGNPALKPVKSKNLDASVEWYYTKQSMVSFGLFRKDLTGYAGTTQVTVPSATAKTMIGSPAYNAAVAACGGASTFCVRNYILNNYNGQPGVTKTGTNATSGEATGTITSDIAGAVPLPLILSTSANLNKSNVKGAEINWQHMFDNGFGFQANYTYVKSSLKYDNAARSTVNGVAQFAMIGLANSANLVGIYENQDLSVRLAYNWRGEFLATTQANVQPQPGYTEPYGQVDLSVGYNLNKNLSLSFEAINLTNATQRQRGRTSNEVLSAWQFGPRYMLGARYKF